MTNSPITATVDFDAIGVQHGFLKLPHSHDASAWGSLMIPITVAKNGDGPTVLFTGGNHGDEYEGPIVLFDLANQIEAEKISGRVIIIPGMNHPALVNGSRTSPIDQGNLNRSFPGNPRGTVTEKIADYFQRTLLPLADYVVDMHSGGKTLEFLPFCCAHLLDDKQQQARCHAAMQAFNAPYSVMLLELDAASMYDTAAETQGKVFIATELAGGGTTTPQTIEIARKGVRNILKHAGVLEGELEISASTSLDMPDGRCFIFSDTSGLVEPCVALGEHVKSGDLIARIFDVERTGRPPVEYRSQIDGVFTGRHFPGRIAMGDIVGVIAVEA